MAHIRVASVLLSLSFLAEAAQESLLRRLLLAGGSTTKSSLPIDIWPFADVAASHIIPDVMPFKANKKQRIWILERRIESSALISVLSSKTNQALHNNVTEKAVRSQGKSFNFMLLAAAAANIIALLA